MNLFDNIIQSQFTKFNGGQSQQLPTFTTPQAPKQINYIPNSIKKVSQSPYGSNPVDNSNSFFPKLLTPVETGVKSVSQNIQQGGQQLSDIAMQHSQSAIDRGYNQGYIDLGQKIKAKHPQYSDMSDEELGRKIVAKYPQYQDIVDAGSGIASNPISGTLASVESGLSKGLGTMFQGISNLGSAPLQESGTAGVTRFTKGALETGLGSAQLATSIMPTTLGAKALVAPTVNTLFSTDTAGKVLQPVTQGIETGIGMGQEALGFNPESSVSKDIQNIGSTAGNLALFAGAQKGGAKIYDGVKPIVTKVGKKVSNIPNPVTGAKNVITREIPVGIMERDLSLTPTERASIETINGKPAGAVALEYNLPKDKQAMADTLSVKADEAYNGITSDLKNITTRTESAPAKEMLGIMLDEMAGSPILVRTMKPYMEKLQSMMEQSDYSLAEKNAIRRDFDRIVANKIFDSKGRVSGIEDKAIANIREGLSTQLQNEAMQYGIDIKGKNDILRTSIALRDGVLRRLSQENKNNKIGLQDIGVGAIFGAGDPFTTASVIFGKKVLENSAPGIAQRLYNSNKTPYATSNLKRGVTISPRDTTNGLSIAPDSVPPVRIPVEKKVVKPIIKTPKVAPKNDTPIIKKPLVTPKKPIVKPNTIKNESKVNKPVSGDTIPEGYFKNAFGEIQKNPSNKTGGFIRNPFAKIEPKRLFAGENSAQPPKGKTGWFKGADGKMRFEIDDSQSKFEFPKRTTDKTNLEYGKASLDIADAPDSEVTFMKELDGFKGTNDEYRTYQRKRGYDKMYDIKKGEYKLGDILQHNDLYKQYPTLANTPVSFHTEGGIRSAGEMTNGKISIGVNTKDPKSVILHEIQHIIQEKEGFAKGGNLSTVSKLDSTTQEQIALVEKEIKDAIKKKNSGDWVFESSTLDEIINSGNSPSEIKQWAKSIVKSGEKSIEDFMDATPWQQYKSLAGEVEARNVQSRMGLTAKERTIKKPESTEDVPRSKQIIRMDSKGTSLSKGIPVKIPEIGKKTPVKNPLIEEARKYKISNNESYLTVEGNNVILNSKDGVKSIYNKFDNPQEANIGANLASKRLSGEDIPTFKKEFAGTNESGFNNIKSAEIELAKIKSKYKDYYFEIKPKRMGTVNKSATDRYVIIAKLNKEALKKYGIY